MMVDPSTAQLLLNRPINPFLSPSRQPISSLESSPSLALLVSTNNMLRLYLLSSKALAPQLPLLWEPLLPTPRSSSGPYLPQTASRLFKDSVSVQHCPYRCEIRLIKWSNASLECRFSRLNALGSDRNGQSGNGVEGWDPSFEIEVPAEQRPANELAALKEEALYSWAQLSPTDFAARLSGLWLLFFIFLGGPIASASFEPSREPLKFILAGGAGSLFAVAVIVLRLYLGWSYVGNRLLSAVVPYEETGWYDGQLWVKPPEVLARDRLLGAYQVKPVMNRLKQTLLGAAALLATATISLFLLTPAQDVETASIFTQPNVSEALAAEGKAGFRKKDLLHLPVEVMDDDELAAAAAAAAKGRPVYCTDRFYRALAGGQYCRWEDLIK